jgi:hypothetical protein
MMEKKMKQNKSTLTPKLRQNWWIDMVLGVTALIAVLSSIYFLIYPISGYQGGRNPQYHAVLIFNRLTWDLLHTWSGVGMIFAAILHIAIHWHWIAQTASRTWDVITRKRKPFGARLTYNIVLDASTAMNFIICTVSGLYFLYFAPQGPSDQVLLFNKTTWDLIHTWSGVLMTIGAILHFALHWKWVTNITGKMFARQKRSKIDPVVKPALESN